MLQQTGHQGIKVESKGADGVCCWQDDPMTNLNTAFDVAEKYLDIPKMLDAEGELAGRKVVK